MKKITVFHFFILNFMIVQIFASERSSWVFVESNDKTRAQSVPYKGIVFSTLSAWSTACKSQPQNRNNADFKTGHSGFASLGSKDEQWREFELVLSAWFMMIKSGSLSIKSLWQSSGIEQMPKPAFYEIDKNNFIPFAQKIIAQPGAEFYIRGDLHGDIFSLIAQLEKMQQDGVIDDHFRIVKDNVWMLFLGDYVDRGQYGCEVLYTMLRLSLANPDRVIFVRGNHEDVKISSHFGFKEEVFHKFNDDNVQGLRYQRISRMNDFLPVVLYVGCQDTQNSLKSPLQPNLKLFVTNYLQCCHGGLEVGYDPKLFLDNHKTMYQMLGLLHRRTFIHNFHQYCDTQAGWTGWAQSFLRNNQFQEMKKWWDSVAGRFQDNILLTKPTDAFNLGFMWNDFDVSNTVQVHYENGRGMYYGKEVTEKILDIQSSVRSKICGVFRAHQHGEDEMMNCLKRNHGVFKLWSSDDAVVAQDSQSMDNFRTLIGGSVWTFNVGADSVYGAQFGFNFDAYARLVVQEQLQDWKLQVFNTIVV